MRCCAQAEAELTGVLEYPDHYSYTLADWQRIARSAQNADMVVTTEKDLVKLERFPFVRDSLYALRLEVRWIEDEDRLLGNDYRRVQHLRSPLTAETRERRVPRWPLSQDLLDILACPKCKGELRLTEQQDGLACAGVQAALSDQGRHPDHADRRGAAAEVKRLPRRQFKRRSRPR